MAKIRKTITSNKLYDMERINHSKMPQVIELEGRRMQWVGIGWVDEGEPTGDETLVIEDDE